MSFRQDRTNPSTAVSNWRGRTETRRGWPSTSVSTWTNGGLFGGSDPSWVMEVIAATAAGTHANFYVSSVQNNPYDDKTYIGGAWQGYAYSGYKHYGPCLGQLAADGSGDLEWWWMGWYGDTLSYRITSSKQQISFAPNSSDVYFGSTFERGSTGSMWARYNSSGTLLNANNDYSCAYSNNRVATDGAVVQQNTGILVGYSRYAQNNWAYDADEVVPQYGSVAYKNAFSNINQPNQGASYYSNGASVGSGHSYALYNDFADSNRKIWKVPMNSTSGATWGVITGLSSNAGMVSTYGSGDNTMGMVAANYPTHVGLLNADLSAFSWSKTITASSGSIEINNDYGPHMDKDGNVYIAGKDDSKGFIIKLDSSGTVLWQRHLSVSTGAGSDTSEIRQVTTSKDGTTVYASMYVSSMQYGGSGTTKFPRMMIWKIKADGSDIGTAAIDNSSGTGSGDADTFTIAASGMTVNAGSLSIAAFTDAGYSQSVRSGTRQNDDLVVQTPWSANSNKPVIASEFIA
jgi:hypothetical protein